MSIGEMVDIVQFIIAYILAIIVGYLLGENHNRKNKLDKEVK